MATAVTPVAGMPSAPLIWRVAVVSAATGPVAPLFSRVSIIRVGVTGTNTLPTVWGWAGGATWFQAAIADHYFDLVVLDFGPTAALDKQLTGVLAQRGSGYHLAATVPAHTSHGTQNYYVWAVGPA